MSARRVAQQRNPSTPSVVNGQPSPLRFAKGLIVLIQYFNTDQFRDGGALPFCQNFAIREAVCISVEARSRKGGSPKFFRQFFFRGY